MQASRAPNNSKRRLARAGSNTTNPTLYSTASARAEASARVRIYCATLDTNAHTHSRRDIRREVIMGDKPRPSDAVAGQLSLSLTVLTSLGSSMQQREKRCASFRWTRGGDAGRHTRLGQSPDGRGEKNERRADLATTRHGGIRQNAGSACVLRSAALCFADRPPYSPKRERAVHSLPMLCSRRRRKADAALIHRGSLSLLLPLSRMASAAAVSRMRERGSLLSGYSLFLL